MDTPPAWIDVSQGNREVFYKRSADGGSTFSPAINVSQTPTNSFFTNHRQLVVGADGSVNILWEEGPPGQDIYFRRSADGGISFSAPKHLSQNSNANDSGAHMAVDGNNITVAWQAQGGFLTRSTDGGNTFAILTVYPNTVFGPLFHGGDVAVGPGGSGSAIYLAPGPTGPTAEVSEVFFMRSTDGGVTLSTPVNLSNNSGVSLYSNQVVDANGTIYVAWLDDTPGNFDILLRRSTDGGVTFSPVVNVTENAGQSIGSAVPLAHCSRAFIDSAGNLSFVWFDSTPGQFDVFYTRSTDGGLTFGPHKNVSESPGQKQQLEAASDPVNGRICIAWNDNKLGNFDVFVSCQEPPVLTVQIDIKPGSFPNSINLGSGGTVPVAIFSTTTFDARNVDPATVTLASAPVKLKGNGTSMASFQDVNGDGLLDLVVHVITEALQVTEGDTEAILEGRTFSGQRIRGTDTVRVVP